MKNYSKRRVLLFAVVSFILLVSDMAFIVINYWSAKSALNTSLTHRSKEQLQTIDIALGMTLRNMLQLATHISHDKKLNQWFLQGKTAVENGSSQSAAAAAIRQKMLAEIKPGWDEMTRLFDVRQLHYHLGPGSLSFLRVHRPEKFGDRMDDVRYTIVDTNDDKKARTGFETGRVYSGLRGVVPLWTMDLDTQEQVYVGALEVGTSYAALLKLIDNTIGIGSAVLLTRQHVVDNMWPDFVLKRFSDVLAICDCYIESTSRSMKEAKVMATALSSMEKGFAATASQLIQIEQQYYSLYYQPLRDYRALNNPQLPAVGVTLIWDDVTDEVKEFHQNIFINIIWAILGFLLVELVLFFALKFEMKMRRMERLVAIDSLTKIFNRRDFEKRIENETRRAMRNESALSVIMCDIDYFKQFNDCYGHLQGDVCLRAVAKVLKTSLHRAADYVARYGGEEFVLVLPDTGLDEAKKIAEKLRLAVMQLGIEHAGSKVNSAVTVSLGVAGVAHMRKKSRHINLVREADKCLYQAKEKGRNCVVG